MRPPVPKPKEALLGLPSIDDGVHCAVCHRWGTDRHHVAQKGMGGVSGEHDAAIPLFRLCRSCHELAHAKKLHFAWDESRGGWVCLLTSEPCSDEYAEKSFWSHYSPVYGWAKRKEAGHVFGARR